MFGNSERCKYPLIDPELVKLKAAALDAGHLKLATWGTKEELEKFIQTGQDKFKS